jgi:AcrR family transcriptional regulator
LVERNECFRSIIVDVRRAVDMTSGERGRLSGRRNQAIRNDARILEAAREIFLADPDAPVSAIAKRAGVGISALYRRYPSKEDLLRQLARDGLRRYVVEAEAAVADEGDAWEAFAAFMGRILDSEVHAITITLAGTFAPTDDLLADAARSAVLNAQIVERTRAAGGLRPDIEIDDLSLILEQLASIRLGGAARTHELRHRYLDLFLAGLRVGGPTLPGPPPTPDELGQRWTPRTRS